MTLLGKLDVLEVLWDQRGLWRASVRRDGGVLHFVMGSTIDGVIAESQAALELQGAELVRMYLGRICFDLQLYETSKYTADYDVAVKRWRALPPLPPWGWLTELSEQVKAKFERLRDMPQLLSQGLQWHHARVCDYENTLRESGGRTAKTTPATLADDQGS